MQLSKELSLQSQAEAALPPSHGGWGVLSPPCTFLPLHKVSCSSLEAMSLLQVTFYFIIHGFAFFCHLQHCFLCQFALSHSWQFVHQPVITFAAVFSQAGPNSFCGGSVPKPGCLHLLFPSSNTSLCSNTDFHWSLITSLNADCSVLYL